MVGCYPKFNRQPSHNHDLKESDYTDADDLDIITEPWRVLDAGPGRKIMI